MADASIPAARTAVTIAEATVRSLDAWSDGESRWEEGQSPAEAIRAAVLCENMKQPGTTCALVIKSVAFIWLVRHMLSRRLAEPELWSIMMLCRWWNFRRTAAVTAASTPGPERPLH